MIHFKNMTSTRFHLVVFALFAIVLSPSIAFAKTTKGKDKHSSASLDRIVIRKKDKLQVKFPKTKLAKSTSKQANEISENSDLSPLSAGLNIKSASAGSPFPTLYEHHEVKKYVKIYTANKGSLLKTTQNTPHIHYVKKAIEQRKLPNELALLPLVESNYQMNAVSNRGAAGIWQFMPETGRKFGLKQSAGMDQRKDVKASTDAALKYLEYLHRKFNRDWLLALAAYNAGEGTVQRAIQKNKKAGKPTNFWSLNLPTQTKQYVPKFCAINKILKQDKLKP